MKLVASLFITTLFFNVAFSITPAEIEEMKVLIPALVHQFKVKCHNFTDVCKVMMEDYTNVKFDEDPDVGICYRQMHMFLCDEFNPRLESRLQFIVEDWVATLKEESTFNDGLPKYLKLYRHI